MQNVLSPEVPLRLLRARDVYLDRLRISRSAFYEMVRAGEFPRPVQISKGRVGWHEGQVDAWIRDRPTAR